MGPQVAKWPSLISGNGGFHGGKWWSQHEDGLAIAFASEDLQKEEKIALMAVKSNTARALGVWQTQFDNSNKSLDPSIPLKTDKPIPAWGVL